ncbi:hypothetical protein [Mycobacterium sp. GA-2829]|uniref:hypothetical protein n=1 Tax=Mycobacterium sp. GA-2829 TaxID=1772283 RepID=UPI0009EC387F|nr:hypothetical protein [Mycobacterium sp. GA-2829]
MKPLIQRIAVSAVILTVLPLIELVPAPVGRAQPPPPPCPPGMYWNVVTIRCVYPPPPAPTVYVDPWLPVYVPDVVDVDLDVDIPVPRPPDIRPPDRPDIGRPGPAPRPPRGRGGGGGRRR